MPNKKPFRNLQKRKINLKKPTKRQVCSAIIPLAVLLATGIILYFVFGQKLLVIFTDPQVFKAKLDTYGAWGEVLFVAVRAAQTVFKFIPAEPLEVASGYAFGVFGGLLWCMVGTQLGSAIILLLSAHYGERFVSVFVEPESLSQFGFLQENPRTKVLLFLIYLIPGAPKDLLTYFVPLTGLKLPVFLVLTTVARIPSIITSTMCGAYFGEKNYFAAAVVYAVTLLLSGAGVLLYRHFTKIAKI